MIAIVTPTYGRRHHLAKALLELLDKLWLDHPQVFFITDSPGIDRRDVAVIADRNWVKRLSEGLKKFKTLYPDLNYVYMLLEDNYPLWDISVERVADAEEACRKHNLNCIVFPPFEYGWSQNEIITAKGILKEVPREFPTYSQLQPAIWNLEHLVKTCELAMQKGVSDPWGFELLVTTGHYASDYQWPILLDGLFKQGFVSTAAVKKIKLPDGVRLKQLMRWEMIFTFPAYLLMRIKDAIRRRLLNIWH